MANVRFPGIDENLTAPNHPWIYYGVRFYIEAKSLKISHLQCRDRMLVPVRPT